MGKLSIKDLHEISRKVKDKDLLPNGAFRAKITVHMGTCGITAGVDKVKKALTEEFQKGDFDDVILTSSGCAGFCCKEPMVTVELKNQPPVKYVDLTPEKILKILAEHVVGGNVVKEYAITREDEDSFFARQNLIAFRNKGMINPEQIDEYIAVDGYKALAKALTEMTPDDIINQIKESGLRGRGGGGFPTGLKWEFSKKAPGDTKFIICNADEGDPGAYMDRSIIESDPHSVLEGMLIGARAIGATEGYIYIRAEYPLARETLEIAIQQARDYGLIGENIFNTDFNFEIHIKQGAGAFVCGEETSLIASIEGRVPEPIPKPPFPALSGLWEKPTNVNNVETWANIPPIINKGAKWYAGIGTEKSKGTKVFSLVGKITNTGLIEIQMGTTLREIIFDTGGGIPYKKKFKAVQTGGPSGGVIPAKLLHLPVDYERLKEAGAIMGSGGMIVVDEDTCMVDLAKYFLEFTSDESCGKCSSCREGAEALYEILQKICKGEGEEEDLDLLEEISHAVKNASMCGLGQTLPNPVLSSLKYFRDEYIQHIKYKRCPAGVCKGIISSACQHACPLEQDVPCYVGLIAQGKYTEALKIIRKENPLPGICGRVCTHPCEAKCRAGKGGAVPIKIKALKRFITDYEMREKIDVNIKSKGRNGRKVAIIGSGPAGLSCGYYLALEGYDVVIFECLPVAGGMLAVGIPEYRLPRDILDYEIGVIKKAGVEIKTNTTVGQDISFEDLRKDYDAVFITTGAHAGLKLHIEGEELNGVIDAVDFLRKVSLGQKPKIGQKVAVIGGGNAAIDAARTAHRLGKDVKIYYRRTRKEMPAMHEEIEEAISEGISIELLTAPIRAIGSDGVLTGVEFIRMKLGEVDESGRARPIPIEGSEFVVDIDALIPAISQEPDIKSVIKESGLKFTKWNTIEANPETFYTDIEGVFAGGDVVTGPDTVTKAIADGKIAASMIDKFVNGRPLIRQYKVTRPAIEVEAIELTEEEMATIKEPAMPVLPIEERQQNFKETELAFTEEMAVREAKRCFRCDLEKSDEE
jgi:NADH-quinone oxidoreductase subunit F